MRDPTLQRLVSTIAGIMRLLNVETLSLEEFWDRAAPPYAILSHTWDKQEVSFQAISDLGTASQLAGFAKI